jgi:hypothetical protein
MAKFQPGQSGNPKGRPPKSRALTELLERAGSKTVVVDGKKISGKRLYAERLWELITTGQVKFENKIYKVQSAKEWSDIVLKMLSHIDGPPKGELDITSAGNEIKINVIYAEDAELTPTSIDSETEGD